MKGNQRGIQSPNFLTFKEPKNRFRGTNLARLWSLAGRYDNPIPTRFLASIVFPTYEPSARLSSLPRSLHTGLVFAAFLKIWISSSIPKKYVLKKTIQNLKTYLLISWAAFKLVRCFAPPPVPKYSINYKIINIALFYRMSYVMGGRRRSCRSVFSHSVSVYFQLWTYTSV